MLAPLLLGGYVSRLLSVFRVMGGQRSDPVHWLCTNVRHLLHRIDDLETKMAVLS